MEYLKFSFWFIVIHTVVYTIAGAFALRLTGKDFYEGKKRSLDFLRDMSDANESKHVQKLFIPAQFLRGLLMSIVLFPILGQLGELSFVLRFAFISGLMFVYTDFASAVAFPNNIEGYIYMKKDRYFKKGAFWKSHIEMIVYSLIFGALVSWFLF